MANSMSMSMSQGMKFEKVIHYFESLQKMTVKVKVIHYFKMMEVSSSKFNVNVNVPGDEV